MSLTDFVNVLFSAAGLAGSRTTSCDAVFDMNGKTASRAEIFTIIENFHANYKLKLNSVEDLAVVPSVLGVTVTSGGGVEEQKLVRIVKIEERGGKKVMTSLVEVRA
ncbi:hypothetical protein B0H17DRAFT_1083000 [Mycena rosella]|uniref:Uncharacterized protein n=1 Tax=Mycena rosella TaxID=1033263 RepID=A0AAD7D4U7_MYCRO|nr:hypothetical protein B0H17DRAFT_1083000 [Mycena rosella]